VPQGLEARIREKLEGWQRLLMRDTEGAREVLRILLTAPLRFTPVVDGERRGYRFTGMLALDRVVEGVVDLSQITRQIVASPTGTVHGWQIPIVGISDVAA